MDKETCLFLLHGMKSSARQIGASSLGNELERSETLLGQSPDASTIELHERLLLSFEECQGAINEVLQRERGPSDTLFGHRYRRYEKLRVLF